MGKSMSDYGIPEYMQGGLLDYIERGVPTGHFLMAVLANDLKRAVEHADGYNIALLPDYVRYLYNNAPAMAWGSKAKVAAWMEAGGIEKIKKDAERPAGPQPRDGESEARDE